MVGEELLDPPDFFECLALLFDLLSERLRLVEGVVADEAVGEVGVVVAAVDLAVLF